MTISNPLSSARDAKWASILRLLLHARRRLSAGGARRGEAELCRLAGLPSCCFARVADRQG